MQYLQLEHITKMYGEQVLFDDISLSISKGDKIALVAKNGSGKSTLLRIIAGEESAEGELVNINMTKGISLSFLKQEPELHDDFTVLEEVLNSDFSALKAIKEYELALIQNDESAIQKAISKIEDNKAWSIEAKVKEILSKLEINNLEQKISNLSGGEKKRVALTKLLIEEPDFIIMDEPTNHLDVEMIEWLEQHFKNPNFTLFIVTHDRYFIETVCNVIIELDDAKLYKYSGGYGDYLEKKQLRLQNNSVVHDKMKQLYKKELDWVRRQPKARGTKAKSRVESFGKIEGTVKSHKTDDALTINMKSSRLGSKILEAHYISKSYGDKKLIDEFFYKFKKGERIGIVGANGVGKTTLLKLLIKEIRTDAGKIIHGETVVFGYYTQAGLVLEKDMKVIDVIRSVAEYIPLEKGRKLTAEKMLENFLFPRPKHQIYVSQLSGGEKKRLYLLSILMKNPNFLILDEPTNDLDIVTLNVLEEYLYNFNGCIIIVSHDRYFMDKLVEHMFVFEGNGVIRDFNGNYTDYREDIKNRKKTKQELPSNTESKPVVDDKNIDFQKRKEIRNLEKSIEKLEKNKEQIQTKFLDADITPELIKKYSQELENINTEIEEKEMIWLEMDP